MAKQTKSVTKSGEITVYTAMLVVAALMLAVGAAVLASANMGQAEAGGNPGSPLNVIRLRAIAPLHRKRPAPRFLLRFQASSNRSHRGAVRVSAGRSAARLAGWILRERSGRSRASARGRSASAGR